MIKSKEIFPMKELEDDSKFTELNFNKVYKWCIPIIKLFYLHKNQDIIYPVDTEFEDYETYKDIYNDFGISNDLVVVKKNYLLIIDDRRDIREQISDAVDSFIPPEGKPTHLFINADEENLGYIYDRVKEIYPNIILVQSIFEKERSTKAINNLRKLLGDKVGIYDCSKECEEYFDYRDANGDSIEKFITLVETIYKNAGKDIITYNGSLDGRSVYRNVVIALYLKYRKTCYVEPNSARSTILSLTDVLCNKETMMIEELDKYIKNLPAVMIRLRDYGVCYETIKNKSIAYQAYFVEIDKDLPKVHNGVITDDSEILSLYNFVDLDSVDGCLRFKEKINELYRYFGKELLKRRNKTFRGIIDATNVIVFKNKGVTYIGVVYDINIQVSSFSYNRNLGVVECQLSYSDLRSCAPCDFFIDGSRRAEVIIKELYKRNKQSSDFRIEDRGRYLGTFIMDADIKREDMRKITNIPLSTVGLFSKYDLLQRQGFIENFIDICGIEDIREQCDCFGGFHPSLVSEILLGRVKGSLKEERQK